MVSALESANKVKYQYKHDRTRTNYRASAYVCVREFVLC